jgi:hypothetical protein
MTSGASPFLVEVKEAEVNPQMARVLMLRTQRPATGTGVGMDEEEEAALRAENDS